VRSIIRCDTNFSEEEFLENLKNNGWLPAEELSDEILDARRTDVLQWFSTEKKEQIIVTFKFMIYHNATESWGVVNSVTDNSFNIRFNNPSVDQIRNCCNEFILSFSEYSFKNKATINSIDFTGIDIQDDDGANQFNGNVLHGKSRDIALERRNNELWLGVGASVVFLILALVVSPVFEDMIFSENPVGWAKFFFDNIGRVLPALLILSVLSFLEVYWELLRVRREAPIKWDEYRARSPRRTNNLSTG